ncbi:unnamed protein product [Sphagnum balticum]
MLYWAPLNLSYFTSGLYFSVTFMYYLKRYKTAWWEKYNYVLAGAFNGGVAFSGLIIFFAVQYHPVFISWGLVPAAINFRGFAENTSFCFRRPGGSINAGQWPPQAPFPALLPATMAPKSNFRLHSPLLEKVRAPSRKLIREHLGVLAKAAALPRHLAHRLALDKHLVCGLDRLAVELAAIPGVDFDRYAAICDVPDVPLKAAPGARLRDRRKPDEDLGWGLKGLSEGNDAPCVLGPRARAVAGVKVAVLEGDLAIRQHHDVGFEAVRDMSEVLPSVGHTEQQIASSYHHIRPVYQDTCGPFRPVARVVLALPIVLASHMARASRNGIWCTSTAPQEIRDSNPRGPPLLLLDAPDLYDDHELCEESSSACW